MFNQLRKIFSATNPAAMTDESRAFIEKLAPSYIWILAFGVRGTPSFRALDRESRLDGLAAHRIDLADVGENDSVVPFNYKHGGRQILPFFSSEEFARQYLAAKQLLGDTQVFQPFRLRAGYVTAPGNEKFDPVLDDGLPSERRLQANEKELLRKITSANA
jgi:hypothetical protein